MRERILRNLTLIPANKVLEDIEAIPKEPGIYLFFVHGGEQLLRATAYFDGVERELLRVLDCDHLYTGAATTTLRERLQTNLRADVTSSSLCRSLLAIERAHRAISESGTPGSQNVRGERSLAVWLRNNSIIGYETTSDPFRRERELLSLYSSPLNIVHRRDDPYARALSAWRCAAFPADRPEHARRVRYA